MRLLGTDEPRRMNDARGSFQFGWRWLPVGELKSGPHAVLDVRPADCRPAERRAHRSTPTRPHTIRPASAHDGLQRAGRTVHCALCTLEALHTARSSPRPPHTSCQPPGVRLATKRGPSFRVPPARGRPQLIYLPPALATASGWLARRLLPPFSSELVGAVFTPTSSAR